MYLEYLSVEFHLGLQVGSVCFCGNDGGTYGSATDSSECDNVCTGDQQPCGGTWRNNLYNLTNVQVSQG